MTGILPPLWAGRHSASLPAIPHPRVLVRAVLFCLLLSFTANHVPAAEVIPAAPPNHFNDYAGLIAPAVAQRLNQELANFEGETSNQIVVAIFRRMQSDSSVEDYATRVAQRWGVGQKGRKNGAVLFVFQESHDVWIATGYGLEGALPDALCKRIIENEIVPRFRNGDFSGGIEAGVHAMMAATRGEYTGTGQTRRTSTAPSRPGGNIGVILVVFIVFILVSRSFRRRGTIYRSRGPATWWGGPPWGGGSWGGGSWGGGGGGTFSGGGGSFGGGGAGGKW